MLYKPLVSLVMVFIATSSVAASATPVRRGLGPGYGPIPPALPAKSADQCNTGNVWCCNGSENCNALSGKECQGTTYCCQSNTEKALIAIECINIGL